MIRYLAASATLLALAACNLPQTATGPTIDPRSLKLASWNMEFLAEKDGTGCQPRTAADYQAMRVIVDGIDADVIAF